jgi:hypothetical protein
MNTLKASTMAVIVSLLSANSDFIPRSDLKHDIASNQEISTTNTELAGWQVHAPKESWADKRIDRQALARTTVEAIIQVTEDSVKAWKLDGSPHPDMEGYVRTKLTNSQHTYIPIRFNKKSRIVVFKLSLGHQINNIHFHNNSVNGDNGNLNGLNSDSFDSLFRTAFVLVTAPSSEKSINVNALISVSDYTEKPVSCKVGTVFDLAGGKYTISGISPYKESDTESRQFSKKAVSRTTIELQSANQSGMLEAQFPKSEHQFDTIKYVNDKGELLSRNITPDSPVKDYERNRVPFLELADYNWEKPTQKIISNLNQKFLPFLIFGVQTTVPVSFNHIPLDPKN